VHHHPNYYKLPKIENREVEDYIDKRATDYKFLVDTEDKSLKEGYGEKDRPIEK